jgi:hypothetical protein
MTILGLDTLNSIVLIGATIVNLIAWTTIVVLSRAAR